MGSLRHLLVAASLAVAVAGCASEVEEAADERAERAGTVMSRVRDGSATDVARRVVGGEPGQGTAIEVLTAEGDRERGRIVLRITEHRERSGIEAEPTEVVRCYEYLLRRSIDDLRPDRLDCPDADPIELAPPTTSESLSGVHDALRSGLEALDPTQRDEAAVRQVARSAGGDARRVEVATHDGVIGIAVGDGDGTCIAGSVGPDGAVEVWTVPRVLAQPGEVGCSAEAAARGLGQRDPH